MNDLAKELTALLIRAVFLNNNPLNLKLNRKRKESVFHSTYFNTLYSKGSFPFHILTALNNVSSFALFVAIDSGLNS